MRGQVDPFSLPERGKMKHYKFKLPAEGRGARRVRMLSPGLNFATLGVVVLVVVHLVVVLTGGVRNGAGLPRELYFDLGLSWAGVSSGKWWQFATHAFLHGSWSHLVLNGLLFYYGAARLGHILGRGMAWRVFVLGVMAGGVAQVGSQALLRRAGSEVAVGGGIGWLDGDVAGIDDGGAGFADVDGEGVGAEYGLGDFDFLGDFLFDFSGVGIADFFEAGVACWYSWVYGFVFQWGHLCHLAGGLAGIWWARKLWGKPVTLEDLQKGEGGEGELKSQVEFPGLMLRAGWA